jgi:hypothetical protein
MAFCRLVFKEGLRAGTCVLEFFTCSAMMFYFLQRAAAVGRFDAAGSPRQKQNDQ